MKIKIIGSGSAGNHIAYAFKNFAKKIYMFDIAKKELQRSKKIYLSRYGVWNKNIIQSCQKIDQNFYDLIIISTPPSTHLYLLEKNLKNADNFLIEKPLCEANKKTLNKFKFLIKQNKNKKFFCGYNHRLFPSTMKLKKILNDFNDSDSTIEINFKENTSGFLKAHYWLKDLSKSYLSKYKEGGGSLLEHSHALNLGQFFSTDKHKLKILGKDINFKKDNQVNYDNSSSLILKYNKKLILINQNFETLPIEKNITINNSKIFARLIYNYKQNNDLIIVFDKKKQKIKKYIFKKKRSDDFKYEAEYFYKKFKKNKKNLIDNTLDANTAIKTMDIALSVLEK